MRTGDSESYVNVPRTLAAGGQVPNTPNMSPIGTDSVMAALTPGEFVIKKSMVDKYGQDFFSALNSGGIQNFRNSLRGYRFAEGGQVPSTSRPSFQIEPGSRGDTIEWDEINISFNGKQFDEETAAMSTVDQLIRLKRNKHPKVRQL